MEVTFDQDHQRFTEGAVEDKVSTIRQASSEPQEIAELKKQIEDEVRARNISEEKLETVSNELRSRTDAQLSLSRKLEDLEREISDLSKSVSAQIDRINQDLELRRQQYLPRSRLLVRNDNQSQNLAADQSGASGVRLLEYVVQRLLAAVQEENQMLEEMSKEQDLYEAKIQECDRKLAEASETHKIIFEQ